MAVGIDKGLTGTLSFTGSGSPTPYIDGAVDTFNNSFPIAGIDQPSNSFRVNSKVIQEAIENLQAKVINLAGDATGSVMLDSSSSAVTLTVTLAGSFLSTNGGTLTGDLIMAQDAGSPGNSYKIRTPSGNNLVLDAPSGKKILLDGLAWPNTDGTAGQVLYTLGTGTLSWKDVLSNVVEDISPSLGGDLDVYSGTQSYKIISTEPSTGHIDLVPNGTDGRVRVWSADISPDGVISARDGDISLQQGGNLTIQGGNGNTTGDGGDVILSPGVGGISGFPGRIKLEYALPGSGAQFATWPTIDGSAAQVLATDGSGNLYWATGGGGGGSGTVTSITVPAGRPISASPNTITTTGTINYSIVSLSENASPSSTSWVVVENNAGGTFNKVQLGNLPGGGGGTNGGAIRAIVSRSAIQSIAASTPTKINWDLTRTGSSTGTAGNVFWTSGNPTRLTIPGTISSGWFKITAGIACQSGPTNFKVQILKNNSSVFIGNPSVALPESGSADFSVNITSPALEAIAGDYFEIEVTQVGVAFASINPTDNLFFSIEQVFGVEKLDDLLDVNVGSPGSGQNGYFLAWDNALSEYNLKPQKAASGNVGSLQYNSSGFLAGDNSIITDGSGNIAITGQLGIDNLLLNSNTLSSLNLNGDIILNPNGTGVVDVSNSRITNVVNPTSAQDAATKAYVDAAVVGSSGTPGGSNTQIQYNSSGVFAGDTGFTTDGLGNIVINGSLDVDALELNANIIGTTTLNGDILIVPNGTGVVQIGEAPSNGTIVSSNAINGSNAGGSALTMQAGDGDNTGPGGNVILIAGISPAGSDGVIQLQSAVEVGTQADAGVLHGADAVGSTNDPGVNLTLRGGNGDGTGVGGDLILAPSTGSTAGKIKLNGLAWPTTIGSANQVLVTDGANTLSWVDALAAGSTTQIQYNNSGSLAGDTGFTTNGSGSVTINTSVAVSNIKLSSGTIARTDAGTGGGDININTGTSGQLVIGDITSNTASTISLKRTRTLAANTLSFTSLSPVQQWTCSQYFAVWLDYVVHVPAIPNGSTGTSAMRMGTLRVLQNGNSIAFDDNYLETAATGISFQAVISGSNVDIQYKNTDATNAAQFEYVLRRIRANS
jgi:hypothetical protein